MSLSARLLADVELDISLTTLDPGGEDGNNAVLLAELEREEAPTFLKPSEDVASTRIGVSFLVDVSSPDFVYGRFELQAEGVTGFEADCRCVR